MKKPLFFLPAIIFTIFYGWVALSGIGAINPIVLVWLGLFWISDILLTKDMFWSGLFGVIPAVLFIYMGNKKTGQIISETPIGIFVLIYYALCSYFVYKKQLPKNN